MRAGPRLAGLVVPVASAAALGALTALVALGVTDGLDERVRALFRPRDEWGEMQIGVDWIIETFTPVRLLALLGAATVVTTLRRRSWRPVVTIALALAAAAALTAGLKLLVARPDTHGQLTSMWGAYPSGHTVTVLMTGGGLALLRRARPGVFTWVLVGAATTVMSWVLMVQTVHWATDVVGSALVAVLVLSVAMTATLGDPAGEAENRSEEAGLALRR